MKFSSDFAYVHNKTFKVPLPVGGVGGAVQCSCCSGWRAQVKRRSKTEPIGRLRHEPFFEGDDVSPQVNAMKKISSENSYCR